MDEKSELVQAVKGLTDEVAGLRKDLREFTVYKEPQGDVNLNQVIVAGIGAIQVIARAAQAMMQPKGVAGPPILLCPKCMGKGCPQCRR